MVYNIERKLSILYVSMDNLEFEKWKVVYLEEQKKERLIYVEQQKKERLLLELEHKKLQQNHSIEVLKYKVEIEKIKAEASQIKKPQRTKSAQQEVYVSDEDQLFNLETLYNDAKDCHALKLSKTQAYHSAKALAESLDTIFHTDTDYYQARMNLDVEDQKKNRTKTLIHMILWSNSISHRAAKWPNASDMEMLATVKDEIMSKVQKYNGKCLATIIEFLQKIWKTKISQTLDLDTTLIGDYIDKTCSEYLIKTSALDAVRTENNPIVNALFEKAVELDPQLGDKAKKAVYEYIKKRKYNGLQYNEYNSLSHHVSFALACQYYYSVVPRFYQDKFPDLITWQQKGFNNYNIDIRALLLEHFSPIEKELYSDYIQNYEKNRRDLGMVGQHW